MILEGGSGGNHSASFDMFLGMPRATLCCGAFFSSLTGDGAVGFCSLSTLACSVNARQLVLQKVSRRLTWLTRLCYSDHILWEVPP